MTPPPSTTTLNSIFSFSSVMTCSRAAAGANRAGIPRRFEIDDFRQRPAGGRRSSRASRETCCFGLIERPPKENPFGVITAVEHELLALPHAKQCQTARDRDGQ